MLSLLISLTACKTQRSSGDDTSTPDSTPDTSDSAQDSAPDTGGEDGSLRFYGYGRDNVDRVRIQLDNPADSAAGPAVDVGEGEFTIEFWLKGSASDNNAPAQDCLPTTDWNGGHVVLDGARKVGDGYGVALFAGKPYLFVGLGRDSVLMCAEASVLDDAWHHVAFQRSASTGQVWLFVDGQVEGVAYGPTGDLSVPDDHVPATDCGPEANPIPCENDPYLVLGAEKHDLGLQNPSFSGSLDELRVSTVMRYDGAFELKTRRFGSDESTAALYHFDEGEGTVLGDSSDNATDGELLVGGTPSGPEWSEESPFDE